MKSFEQWILDVPYDFKKLYEVDCFCSKYNLLRIPIEPHHNSSTIYGKTECLKELELFIKDYDGLNLIKEPKTLEPKFKSLICSCEKLGDDIKTTGRIQSNVASRTFSRYFNAKEIREIHELSNGLNRRVNIAIISLGGGYSDSDLDAYWNYIGLETKPNTYSVSVMGATNQLGSYYAADLENALDIQIVGGVCPLSNIYIYFAPNTSQGFYRGILSAITNRSNPVDVISISWGLTEDLWEPYELHAYNNLFRQAANRGINIFCASGDHGSSDGLRDGKDHVNFPASSPWVIACGGTTLTCPTRSYDHSSTEEVTWRGSGGGFSNFFPKPSYQNGLTDKFGETTRGVPDVCGNADNRTGWIIIYRRSLRLVGGTSAVSPMWAGFIAQFGLKRFLNDVLYQNYKFNRTITYDILFGSQGTYKAENDWDPATGLGSPNGEKLKELLSNY